MADITAHLETVADESVKIGSPGLRACEVPVNVASADALDADRRWTQWKVTGGPSAATAN